MSVRKAKPKYRRQRLQLWTFVVCFLLAGTGASSAFGERAQPAKGARPGSTPETGDAAKARGTARPPIGADVENRKIQTVDTKAVLTEAFEQRARELLERYIPAREFQVSVNVTPTKKALPLTPYDPSGLILSRSTEELGTYVQKVELEVLLTARLASTKNRLQQLLFKELELSQKRGDRVRFGDLGIEIDTDAWRQEKSELKNNLDRMKAENDRLGRDLARANQQEGFLGKWTLWAILGVIVAVFGCILLGLWFAGRSISGAGKNLTNAFTTMAAAVESVGSNIGVATGVAAPSSSDPKVMEGKFISEGGHKSHGLASLPMESLQTHFGKLRVEILESANENTEAVILRQLTQLLANPATVGRAVVTLELLGREMATEMFKRLGLNSQEAILKFMREGAYESTKVEMMLEAGEELKTRLLVDSLDMARGRPSDKVAEKVLQLTDEDLANVAIELAPELMPRLFLYLDATKIAMLLAGLKGSSNKNYSKVLGLLSKMPEAEKSNNQDADLMRGIEAILNRTKSDAQRPFLKVYKEIIEAAEDDLSEEIVRELSSDPRLDLYFRENVITIRTLFKLTEEARTEIIEGLSNKDVAALALGVRDDERKVIMQGLPARRKGMIAEEFESLSSRGGRQAQYAFKRVRDVIVKKLADMKEQGMLTSVIRRDGDKTAKAAAAGGGGGSFGKGKEPASTGTNTGIARAGAAASATKASPGLKPLTTENTNMGQKTTPTPIGQKTVTPQASPPPKPPVKKTG